MKKKMSMVMVAVASVLVAGCFSPEKVVGGWHDFSVGNYGGGVAYSYQCELVEKARSHLGKREFLAEAYYYISQLEYLAKPEEVASVAATLTTCIKDFDFSKAKGAFSGKTARKTRGIVVSWNRQVSVRIEAVRCVFDFTSKSANLKPHQLWEPALPPGRFQFTATVNGVVAAEEEIGITPGFQTYTRRKWGGDKLATSWHFTIK